MLGECKVCSEHILECTCDREFFDIVKQCEFYDDNEDIRNYPSDWHPIRKAIYRSAISNQNELMSQINNQIRKSSTHLEIHFTKSAVMNFLVLSLRKMISSLPEDQILEVIEYINEKMMDIFEDKA